MTSSIVSAKFTASKTERTCHGCLGEYPIHKGDQHLVLAASVDGAMKNLHFCVRCAGGLAGRVRSSERRIIDLSEGCLKWPLLASPYKKRWAAYVELCKRAAMAPGDKELSDALTKASSEMFDF